MESREKTREMKNGRLSFETPQKALSVLVTARAHCSGCPTTAPVDQHAS
jgi:hypothetical protein